MEVEEKIYKKKQSWITEGIVIGLMTIVAYGLTYIYKYFYLLYYGIPNYFIYLDLKSIITALFFVGIPLIGFIFMLIFLKEQLRSTKLWHTLIFSCLWFIGLSISYLVDVDKFKYYIFLYYVILSIGLNILSVRLRKQNPNVKELLIDNLNEIKNNILSVRPIIIFNYIFFTIIVLGFLVFSLAYSRAFKQTNFLITSTKQEMLVITQYENNLICIPFNRETKEANKRFMIIDPTTNPDINYHLETVGPIKMID